MLTLLYFAWVRERMGIASETIPLPKGAATVTDLVEWLRTRNDNGARAFHEPTLIRAAINQDFATATSPVADGDEVAFFPPVTGG